MINILFNINLEDYFEMKQRDYLGFSAVELSNNLLSGQVIFVDEKENNSIVFEAELLKFFMDIYNSLIESKNVGKVISIYSIYQSYMFEIIVENNDVHLTYNSSKKLTYSYKVFLKQLKKNKNKLYKEYKLLYPDYGNMKNGGFLIDYFESS